MDNGKVKLNTLADVLTTLHRNFQPAKDKPDRCEFNAEKGKIIYDHTNEERQKLSYSGELVWDLKPASPIPFPFNNFTFNNFGRNPRAYILTAMEFISLNYAGLSFVNLSETKDIGHIVAQIGQTAGQYDIAIQDFSLKTLAAQRRPSQISSTPIYICTKVESREGLEEELSALDNTKCSKVIMSARTEEYKFASK
ncbi:MAG: hypothetical protein Q8O89_01190 [Nanoarchaeota archaeon]|nr:hypothetical protein [Nanoarchaeota archaeon]